jgi:hypothetical protein
VQPPDEAIDTSDIPEVTDFSKAVRGGAYRDPYDPALPDEPIRRVEGHTVSYTPARRRRPDEGAHRPYPVYVVDPGELDDQAQADLVARATEALRLEAFRDWLRAGPPERTVGFARGVERNPLAAYLAERTGLLWHVTSDRYIDAHVDAQVATEGPPVLETDLRPWGTRFIALLRASAPVLDDDDVDAATEDERAPVTAGEALRLLALAARPSVPPR